MKQDVFAGLRYNRRRMRKWRRFIQHCLLMLIAEHTFVLIVIHSPLKKHIDSVVPLFWGGVLFPWGVWSILKLNVTSLKFDPPLPKVGGNGLLEYRPDLD